MLSVLVLNVDATNDAYDAVAALVRERDPDVLAVLELTPEWLAGLEGTLDAFESRSADAREGSYGLGLFSRLPVSSVEILSPTDSGNPVLTATITTEGGPIRLALLHPRVPSDPTKASDHLTLLRTAGEAAVSGQGEGVVLGDLNTTPWSARFRELTEDAGLADTREGYGLQASWPSFFPGPLRIPIDHVLVTDGLAAVEREVGPAVGSDHLPVWVELAFRET